MRLASYHFAAPPHFYLAIVFIMVQPTPSKRHSQYHCRHLPCRITIDTDGTAKPCVFYQSNSCPLSAAECDFAHILAGASVDPPLLTPLRTKPCKFFAAGRCKDGVWCRFKHPVSVVVQVGSGTGDDYSGDQSMDEDDVDDATPDVRDLDPQLKAPQESHPKYRSEFSLYSIFLKDTS